ncbi:MAG TPA: tetratricopeptide repeat protein [Candidatus Udaeobacter sp.]
MPTEPSSDVKFEIGHVLFIDIVAYSKLLITEQSEHLQTLKQIVRGTEQFRLAEAEGKMLRLPTGDGGALVFRTSPEAPVLCALEISKALKSHPELRVRMGIHSGPVNEISDLNEQANIAGAGINVAERVMDCGDAGHILLSQHVAEDLEQYPRWRPYLHDLGTVEVKHGVRVNVANLYSDEIGNPKLPSKLQAVKKHRAHVRWAGIAASLLVLMAIIGGAFFFLRHPGQSASAIVDKSIAVLPFENLSAEKQNEYFAEGVQDEILTRLAKVADLKVIARTSTQKFKSAPADLREVAKQLGVANILEGSVQKANDQVRVNVQLINALTNAHLWAEIYDRKLTDIFAVESDIAKTIADTLQAKLSGSEKIAMANKPTENPEAYELYLKGRFFWNKRTGADLRKAIGYFDQAISKDPSYALAYAGLADSYLLLPAFGAASPQDSIPQAKAAAKHALELDDSLAEAHASSARILSGYDFAFDRSIKEFERAIQLNPNYAMAHHWISSGPLTSLAQFDRAIAEGSRAIELDPLSLVDNVDLGWVYFAARRYDEAIGQLRKAIEIDSRSYLAHYTLGEVFQLKGQLADAITEYRRAVELDDDPFALAVLGQAYARAGQRDEAQKILARLREEAKSRYVSAYGVALMFIGLGDKEQAMDALERAFREGAGNDLNAIKVDPILDDLRGQPRFEALAQKILAQNR